MPPAFPSVAILPPPHREVVGAAPEATRPGVHRCDQPPAGRPNPPAAPAACGPIGPPSHTTTPAHVPRPNLPVPHRPPVIPARATASGSAVHAPHPLGGPAGAWRRGGAGRCRAATRRGAAPPPGAWDWTPGSMGSVIVNPHPDCPPPGMGRAVRVGIALPPDALPNYKR